jgi:hypothetical protein
MQIYWTSLSFPELSKLPSDERRRILGRCGPQTFRHWQTWVALCVALQCVWIAACLGWFLTSGSWAGPWSGAVLGALVGSAVGGALLGQVKGSLVRPYIRAELKSRPIGATYSR